MQILFCYFKPQNLRPSYACEGEEVGGERGGETSMPKTRRPKQSSLRGMNRVVAVNWKSETVKKLCRTEQIRVRLEEEES